MKMHYKKLGRSIKLIMPKYRSALVSRLEDRYPRKGVFHGAEADSSWALTTR